MRTALCLSRRQVLGAALGVGVVAAGARRRANAEARAGQGQAAQVQAAQGQAARAEVATDPWPSLAEQIFGNRQIVDGNAVLAIDAPYRAEDAAVVPISIRTLLPTGDPQRIRNVTLVIDENPSPLAARFSFGASSGIRTLATRVRVNSYTKIHAVGEMSDGRLLAVERFVKAAGGCSAPASKQEADSVPNGRMRFRLFPGEAADDREAQLMIRHPNYSGMQMDQATRLYMPAHFISSIKIWQGEDLLLGIESGISISENPEIRFDYRPNGATAFRAEAQDNEGMSFTGSWAVTRA
jgi:sulfur-oxidizing protein SoxY